MTKKIIIIILLFGFIISCGKKGNPEYKSSQSKIKIFLINII